MSEKEYNSIEEMVKNCSPEQLEELFDNYLIRNGFQPIFSHIRKIKRELK